MKRTANFFTFGTTAMMVAGIAAMAFAQQRIVFRDSVKNTKIRIEGDKGYVVPNQEFELSGKVVVQNYTDGSIMRCETISGKLESEVVDKKTVTRYNMVRLRGGVFIEVKSTAEKNASSLKLNSKEVDYDINKDSASKATLKLRGGVTLDFADGANQKVGSNAKGSSATVVMLRTAKPDEDALLTAQMEGPVTYVGQEQFKTEGVIGYRKVQFFADRLSYAKVGASGNREINLRGNLKFIQGVSEVDDDGPSVTGAQIATLELNDKNEIIRVRFSSEGQGQVRTVIKKKPGAMS